ncbi:MAG: hypothetical protein N3A53_00555 [Verrucomicrobiae bacterium]|nr:hypothetical protein [Verrucomicrobiae bacterium]
MRSGQNHGCAETAVVATAAGAAAGEAPVGTALDADTDTEATGAEVVVTAAGRGA